MSQYIYALEGWQHVKLGQTGKPHHRVRPLETQGGWRSGAFCFYAVIDMAKAERRLFAKFNQRRQEGEWFDIGFVDAVKALRDEQARQVVQHVCTNMQGGSRPTPKSVRNAAAGLGILLCRDADIITPLKTYLSPPKYNDFLQVLFNLRSGSEPSFFNVHAELLCRAETAVGFFRQAEADGHIVKSGGRWCWPIQEQVA